MAQQLQLRRGTSSQIAAFTGAQGEIAVDTTTSRTFVNDGATVGGFPCALETFVKISDAAYSALITDRQIAYGTLTAPRIVTLPAANGYPSGATLVIIDESGSCSAINTITIARTGSDLINFATSAFLASAYASIELESNGFNGWVIVNQTTPQATASLAQSAKGAMAQIVALEQTVSGLTGASVTAATPIPAGALLLACTARVVTAITGATSFSVGYTGSTSAFGSSLALSAGTTNEGLIGPNPFYAATSLLLTPAGSNFTAGAVRLTLFYLSFAAATN